MFRSMTSLTVSVKTERKIQAINVTSEIKKSAKGLLSNGIINIFCPHTTAGLLINEAEEGLMEDIERTGAELIKGSDFKHDRIDNNATAHLTASFLSSSIMVPVTNGNLVLGTWQSVIFLEMDGPRSRNLEIYALGEEA